VVYHKCLMSSRMMLSYVYISHFTVTHVTKSQNFGIQLYVSATSDLAELKLTSGKKLPREIFKMICLIPDNYTHGLRYSHLLFVTHVTARKENVLPNGILIYFPGNLIILYCFNFPKKYTGT
jgi:hypothetical protein